MPDHNHVLTGDVVGCLACDKRQGRPTFVERRAEEPVEPDLSTFPEVQHRIEGGRFVCPGDEGSRCHQYPDCAEDGTHEAWPCGCEYVSHAECWIKPWIDATDLADSYSGGEHELLLRDEDFPDGDVSWSWEGEWVSFDYVPYRTIRHGENVDDYTMCVCGSPMDACAGINGADRMNRSTETR